MPEDSRAQLRIAVCDDEPADRRGAADLTREVMAAEGVACDLAGYASAAALLAAVRGGARFHILLLDVMMPGLDGMALAEALREMGEDAAIIFLSSNREMALRGYEVSAARYLAKPLRAERLREALLYCYRTCCESREILLPTEKGRSKLPPADIIYVEAWARGARLHLAGGPIETSLKFSDVAARLPERSFALCHRTVLVNLAYVRHLRTCEIELADGRTLPVSKHRRSDFKARLLRYVYG